MDWGQIVASHAGYYNFSHKHIKPTHTGNLLIDAHNMTHLSGFLIFPNSDRTPLSFHRPTHPTETTLGVLFIKGNRCYPITDERLKMLATKANQGGVDNLWKFMGEMKWSRRHEQFVVINDMEEEEQLAVSNKIIILPEDEKIEPVIDRYIYHTNYFMEYLHFNNNGRLDGFIDHRSNMFILNDQYETRKLICDSLFDKFKTADFVWSNQSFTNMAFNLFKQMCGYLPKSNYDVKTQQVLDDFYP